MTDLGRRDPVKRPASRLDRVREELRVWGVGTLAVLGIGVGGTVIRVWRWLSGRPTAQEMAQSWREMTMTRQVDPQQDRKRPVSSIRKALDRYGR